MFNMCWTFSKLSNVVKSGIQFNSIRHERINGRLVFFHHLSGICIRLIAFWRIKIFLNKFSFVCNVFTLTLFENKFNFHKMQFALYKQSSSPWKGLVEYKSVLQKKTHMQKKSTKILLHAFGKFISSIFNFNILFFWKMCVSRCIFYKVE